MRNYMIAKNLQSLNFIFYFIILLLLGTVVSDIQGQPDLFANIENFMATPGVIQLGDPSFFASGAIDVYQNGWFSPEKKWLINLWPPGFMLLEASIIKAFGIDTPFVLILVILASTLGAAVLLLLRNYLLRFVSPGIATFLPLMPFFFPVTRLTILQPMGVVLGESFSILFFIAAVILILRAFRDYSFWDAIAAGLTLALAAYFRSQFEILVMFLTVGAIPIVGWSTIKLWNGSLPLSEKINARVVIGLILLTLFTAHLAMLPWRIHNLMNPYASRITWVGTESITYLNAGQTNEQLFKAGAGWVVEGGGNLACNLEPTYCGKGDKILYYAAFFKHMWQWYSHKFALVGKYWFSSINNFTSASHPSVFLDDMVNLLLFLSVLATIPLLWLARRLPDSSLYVWVLISFYSCFFVVFTFVQLEVRYFYLIKIFSLFTTIMLCCRVRHFATLSKRKFAIL